MNTLASGKYLQWWLAVLLVVVTLSSRNNVDANTGNFSAEDRQEIMVLIYNYSYMFDSRNLDGFVNLYSQDAIWEAFFGGSSSPAQVLDTPNEMRQFFGDQMQQYAADGIQSRHFLTNLAISRTGPGLAEGTAMFVVTHQAYNQPQGTAVVLHTGAYKYQSIKTHAGWRFRRIEAHVDHS